MEHNEHDANLALAESRYWETVANNRANLEGFRIARRAPQQRKRQSFAAWLRHFLGV